MSAGLVSDTVLIRKTAYPPGVSDSDASFDFFVAKPRIVRWNELPIDNLIEEITVEDLTETSR